ncbi:Threonine efflux protein [Pseudodesulfovibrio hydrargyri]|uniref:Threonine efflux protein n=1 Tax=Pseudodesulfovibrio hydrargyri TaxID=2125990 RepID=A0A1J5N8Q2_9BACT|nr:LysE family transporter [Pseudodesulfovibrio hydrargyri]OIQ52011.1 Threonine efflux protein [Pseudodesulfovibrio hydrargyri]
MSDYSFLWGFGLVWALAVILPGPNFLVAARSGLTATRGRALLTALGIATGSVTWAFSAMVGLHALFLAFAWLYGAVKILGGLYLLYVGLTVIRSAFAQQERATEEADPGRAGGYRIGLLTNLSNPKSAAFFGSMFLTLLPQQLDSFQSLTTLALVFAISLSWYSLVAVGFSLGFMHRGYQRVQRGLSACIGSLMLFFGVRLIFAKE